jgi:hypothetical protein
MFFFTKHPEHINAAPTDSGVVKNRIKLLKLEVCFLVVSSKFVIEFGTCLLIVAAAPQSASNWEALKGIEDNLLRHTSLTAVCIT